MGDIIEYDFRQKTDILNRVRRLLNLLHKRNEEILADPLRYFNELGMEYCKYREKVFRIYMESMDKRYPPVGPADYKEGPKLDFVSVSLREYTALREMAERYRELIYK